MNRAQPFTCLAALAFALLARPAHAADVPPPSGAHPRIFLNPTVLAAIRAKAQMPGTAAANWADGCQETIDHPEWYTDRGGVDASTWPGAALSCAFAYLVTDNGDFLTQSIKYWNASMNDDQTLGDNLGCTANVDTNWQSWDGSGPVPPVIQPITHDTGYPIRWYGPFIAMTYDWLHDAPGVDEALRAHTRMCLQNWIDYYTDRGYHADEAGANYNAGYVFGKTLTAIAIAGENGADGDRLWTETLDDVFDGLLIGEGLAGRDGTVGMPFGPLVDGDWGEGWQYGPLSVTEYALSTRALEENGASLPEMRAWTNSLILRYLYATVPTLDGHFAGGDFEDAEAAYPGPNAGVLAAVVAGPSNDQAAAWALSMRDAQGLGVSDSPYVSDVLAEIRDVTPESYTEQSPAPPLWYLARGTRALYVRSSWDTSAFWGVFSSAPGTLNSDHHHFDASNFVFSRGGDHLIVDGSGYGTRSTLPSNAVTADAETVSGTYAPSQTPWGTPELVWARAAEPAVYAARSDFHNAFQFQDNVSDVTYAHREWVFLPEGEIVTIDRVHTSAAERGMYVNFHTNTGGTLMLGASAATGTVGSSQVAIHPIFLSGGVPAVVQPPVGEDCYDGTCEDVTFAMDEYSLKVPGPWAVAVHVIDGLANGEDPAEVGSLTDAVYDPEQTNADVLGAAVYRGMKQSFVVASSAEDGRVGDSMTYGVPGAAAARHIVFDAPEDADGKSLVSVQVDGDRCQLTITAGNGFTGRPLMFQVSAARDGCEVSEDTNVPPGTAPPPDTIPVPTGSGGSSAGAGGAGGAGAAPAKGSAGCTCRAGSQSSRPLVWVALLLTTLAVSRRKRPTR